MKAPEHHPASYRDPSGFIYLTDGIVYRQVHKNYAQHYEHLKKCGLYNQLVQQKLLIPHMEVAPAFEVSHDHYKTLRPEKVPVISYPYEWSFDILKDAALLTLNIATQALDYEMTLKDASAYNVQLQKGKLIFIDTLSFELSDFTKPWVAYRQFCEHFLAPLALMHFFKTPCQPLLYAYPDGIPLPLAAKMLPLKSKFNWGCLLHIHFHARYSGGATNGTSVPKFSKKKLRHILHSLSETVKNFSFHAATEWNDYYVEAAQRANYLEQKKTIISSWLPALERLKTATDLGANEGVFSLLLAEAGIRTIAADGDANVVNQLYQLVKSNNIENVVPLLIDLSNPSGGIGFHNIERTPFATRAKCDLVLALALIHHLAISKHISFRQMASFFADLGPFLLIEFVSKEDEKVAEMMATKTISYDWYTIETFEADFSARYEVLKKSHLAGTNRTLYLMHQHGHVFTK